MAPHIEQSERPVGPDSEAAAPSPTQIEEKAVVEHPDLPKAIPTKTDDPDRVVTPNDTPKPIEEEPKITTVETVASVASAASEETATPSIEKAPEAPTPVAPAIGTGESMRRARVTWQKELAAHFDKYKRYPADRVTQMRRSRRYLCSRPQRARAVHQRSQRIRRFRRSTQPRSPCCNAPILCRRRRRLSPTKD